MFFTIFFLNKKGEWILLYWDKPDTPQDFSSVQDSQELIFCCGLVEIGSLFIDKESVWNPDQLNVVSTDNQFFQTRPTLE